LNGYSEILDYRISYAEQGFAYQELTSVTDQNYVVTGLTAGVTYLFKVEARNQYGSSLLSEELSLLCASIPEVPTSVVTEIDGSNVKVTWSLSTSNGSPITAFNIYVKEIGTD
jgi:hypothetical protein